MSVVIVWKSYCFYISSYTSRMCELYCSEPYCFYFKHKSSILSSGFPRDHTPGEKMSIQRFIISKGAGGKWHGAWCTSATKNMRTSEECLSAVLKHRSSGGRLTEGHSTAELGNLCNALRAFLFLQFSGTVLWVEMKKESFIINIYQSNYDVSNLTASRWGIYCC